MSSDRKRLTWNHHTPFISTALTIREVRLAWLHAGHRTNGRNSLATSGRGWKGREINELMEWKQEQKPITVHQCHDEAHPCLQDIRILRRKGASAGLFWEGTKDRWSMRYFITLWWRTTLSSSCLGKHSFWPCKIDGHIVHLSINSCIPQEFGNGNQSFVKLLS